MGDVQPALSLGDAHVEAAGRDDLGVRWKGGLVPYFLQPSGSKAVTPAEVANFHAAVSNIESRTPITFKEYDQAGFDALPSSADIIHVYNDSAAKSVHSKVGRQGGTQDMTLGSAGPGGSSVKEITHALGFALGLRGEQQRGDRSSVLSVCPSNAATDSYDEQTDIYGALTPYDLHSVMHFFEDEQISSSPGTGCGGHTMTLLDPAMNTYPFDSNACVACPTAGGACATDCHSIGGGEQLSAEDINGLTLMYGKTLSHAKTNAGFGTAMVVADLDRDGRNDIVISAPGEDGHGSVYAFKGTLRGMAPWKQLRNSSVAGDDFGRALATGDFNHDGFPDVAVGAPGKAVSGLPSSGTVTIYYGGRFNGAQLTPDCATNPICQTGGFPDIRARVILSPQDAVGGVNEAGDLFGTALAVADFDHDGFDDLVVGAPGKANGDGRVFVYSGKKIENPAPIGAGPQKPGIMLGANTKGGFGHFGSALATGDLNGDNFDEIAVGSPDNGAGTVSIFQTGSITSFFERSVVSAPTPIQSGDQFGAALIIARFAAKTRPGLLAVGAPRFETGHGHVNTFNFSGFGNTWSSNMIQTIPYGNMPGNFGAAFATLDADNDGTPDLVVGAPLYAAGAQGGVAILRSSAGHFTTLEYVPAPATNNPGKFGSSFAVGKDNKGKIQGDDVLAFTPGGRLLISAPALLTALPYPAVNAGHAYAYSIQTPTTGVTDEFGAEYNTFYANP